MKRFAPLTLLFGLLTALMLGGTATAQANPSGFTCDNTGVGVITVTCNTVIATIPVVVTIPVNRVLNGNEISILEDNLNHTNINVLSYLLSLGNIDATVLNFANSLNPALTVGNIGLCIASLCG